MLGSQILRGGFQLPALGHFHSGSAVLVFRGTQRHEEELMEKAEVQRFRTPVWPKDVGLGLPWELVGSGGSRVHPLSGAKPESAV